MIIPRYVYYCRLIITHNKSLYFAMFIWIYTFKEISDKNVYCFINFSTFYLV